MESLQITLQAQKQELGSLQDAGEQEAKLTAQRDKMQQLVEDLDGLQMELAHLHQIDKKLSKTQQEYRAIQETAEKSQASYDHMRKAYLDEQGGDPGPGSYRWSGVSGLWCDASPSSCEHFNRSTDQGTTGTS